MSNSFGKSGITREDLQDIMDNKPHGYFAKYMKGIKNKKRYSVTCTAVKETVIATNSIITFSDSVDGKEIWIARDKLRNMTQGDDVFYRFDVTYVT